MQIKTAAVIRDGLSESEFEGLSRFIYSETGIKISANKKIMLEARLRKRLKDLDIVSYSEYCNLILKEKYAEEIVHFIDVVTTNKTDFFREPGQYYFLTEKVLPELKRVSGIIAEGRLNIWSAGCSTGEEPYTLAMLLSDYFGENQKENFRILATDISTQVLEKAELAVYEEEKITPVPQEFKRRYLLRNKNRSKKIVRIVPELRKYVDFRRVNLMYPEEQFPEQFTELFHIIFCRNVIIYFDRNTQYKVIDKLCEKLMVGGYLFIGHSESLLNMELPLLQVAPSIYRRI